MDNETAQALTVAINGLAEVVVRAANPAMVVRADFNVDGSARVLAAPSPGGIAEISDLEQFEIAIRQLGKIRALCARETPGAIADKLGLSAYRLTKIIQLCHGIAEHMQYDFDKV